MCIHYKVYMVDVGTCITSEEAVSDKATRVIQRSAIL